jgi:hypothetical protein
MSCCVRRPKASVSPKAAPILSSHPQLSTNATSTKNEHVLLLLLQLQDAGLDRVLDDEALANDGARLADSLKNESESAETAKACRLTVDTIHSLQLTRGVPHGEAMSMYNQCGDESTNQGSTRKT